MTFRRSYKRSNQEVFNDRKIIFVYFAGLYQERRASQKEVMYYGIIFYYLEEAMGQ